MRSVQRRFAPFWACYAVVVALCVATACLRGHDQLIAFVAWTIAAVVDVILLVRAARP